MTRETILRNRLEMASHNLLCCSANYLCTIPKDDMEVEYGEAAAEVEMLTTWLKEFHRSNVESIREFIGHISTISYGSSYDNQRLALQIEFEVDIGAGYLDGDVRTFNLGPEVQDWFVGENAGCGRYDIEKDRRHSRLLKITVDKIEYARSIEWIVAEVE